MATNTYTAIATQTLASTATSVTFSGIDQGYTDLVIVANMKMGASTYQPLLRFNGDSGSNYSSTTVWGNGSSAGSNRHTNQNGIYANPGSGVGTAGNFEPWIINVQSYSNTNVYKSTIERFSNPDSVVNAGVGLWRNTAAITSITLVAESGSNDFQVGSTFSLYGIAAAAVPTAKATGGTITYDASGYIYHTFTSSGTFTPTQSLTADVLVVGAGGGGGAGSWGGGGGGGQIGALSSFSASVTPYTVTVGAGGAANTQGTSSVFSTLTSVGGYGGGSNSGSTGGNNGAGTYTGGSQNGTASGGGAGDAANGGNASGYAGGNGGSGTSATIGSVVATYAGGGGGGSSRNVNFGGSGGSGSAGGGGNGGVYNGYGAGAGGANTGGGGGGSGGSGGASGGSGIVIIRYAS